MFGNQLRCCCHVKHFSPNVLDITNSSNLKNLIAGIGQQKSYSNKSGCCKDMPQTKGRKVEVWPKPDPPPPAWRIECPADPQPPNYDPYRIKGPEIVVPPLKGGPAKGLSSGDAGELFRNACVSLGRSQSMAPLRDLFHNSPIVHPDYWKDQPGPPPKLAPPADVLPKLGYHGRNKYKYAFHEPWKPLDRLTLLEQAEKDESELSREMEVAEKVEKEIT